MISASPSTFRLGSRIYLTVELKNISQHKIWAYRPPELAYQIQLRDAAGRAVKPGFLPSYDKNGRRVMRVRIPAGPIGGIYLPPDESITDTLFVSDSFQLAQPGKYSVEVEWQDPETKATVGSNTVEVMIEDPGRFNERFAGRAAPFSLDIASPSGTVKTGSGVALIIYTTNLSDQELKLDCGRFDFQIQDSQGNPVSWIAGNDLRKVHEYGSGHVCRVEPHDTDVTAIHHLEKLYDLSKPGQYTIQASRFDDTAKTWVKSNTITLTVTPR
jgi:hypothetical protein